MSKMTASKLHEIIGFDHISKHKGVFKVYRGYFYRMGMDERKLSAEVDARLTKAGIAHTMLDCGDHFAVFRGGDSIQKGSHFWATFTVTD